MSKKTKIIISILGFLVLIAGIAAGVYLVQKNQDIREKAAPATTLSLSPSTINKNPGQTINLTINANTNENKITGIDIEVSFDSSVIQLNQMSATSSISNLSTIIKNGEINNTTGKARFAAFTVTKSQAISGNISLISLTGTIVNNAISGNYPITFTENTTLAAADEGQNVLINKSSASVIVSSGGGGTQQPTATATATSTAKATATATSTPIQSGSTSGGTGGSNVTVPTTTPTPIQSGPKQAAVQTSTPDLPVTGVSLPFMAGVSLGVIGIVTSLFLAF